MQAGGIDPLQGRGRLDVEPAVGRYSRRDGEFHIERFGGHLGEVGSAFFLGFLLFLFPFLPFLLHLFQPFFERSLGQKIDCVGLFLQHAERIGFLVSHHSVERVSVYQCRVTQPVVHGVLLQVGFHKKSLTGIEVDALYLRQLFIAIGEVEGHFLGVFPFCLEEMAFGELCGEGGQCDIVGQEVGIAGLLDIVYMQRVAPDGVLSDVGFRRRYDDIMAEGQFFRFLRVEIVAVHVVEGIGSVLSRCHAFDDEMSAAVGSRHPEHRLFLEGTVGQVAVESYEDAFDGFQIFGLEHIASHLHGVDVLSGREAVGVVAQRVALVVVGDGVGEIDGVGGIGFERVVELYGDAFALPLDDGCLELWR